MKLWKRKTVWPLMELPPLSPGIQERVIEVVVVLVTVRRGWSGGTEAKKTHQVQVAGVKICISEASICKKVDIEKQFFPNVVFLTLNLQVEDDLVWPKTVTCHTCVVPRILCFHSANNKAAVTVDAAPAVNHNRCWSSISKKSDMNRCCFQHHRVTLKSYWSENRKKHVVIDYTNASRGFQSEMGEG